MVANLLEVESATIHRWQSRVVLLVLGDVQFGIFQVPPVDRPNLLRYDRVRSVLKSARRIVNLQQLTWKHKFTKRQNYASINKKISVEQYDTQHPKTSDLIL
jgi:hypothetical protein